MKLALVPLEEWERLNDQLKIHFALPADNTARIYKGLAHAVFEVAQGTAQFLSHKRSLGVVKGQTPYFDSLLPYFYKEVFNVQAVNHLALTDPEAWVNGLKKDTTFVMFAEDHPVTGELYNYDRLDELLNEKKIFAVRISHFRHFYETAHPRPYSVRICYLNNDYAVALCGERFKTPALIAPQMNWHVAECLSVVQKIHVSPQDKALVESFEKSFSDIATPWFAQGVSRLYERVLLKFPEVSAEALLQRLYDHLQVDSSKYYETMDTTNLCRWHHFKTFNSWWEPKPTMDDLSSLLVIDSGWLVTKDFAKILKSSYEEIKAEQSW
ncbi:hypothetical protein [Bdellovibrio sp. HCB337]|uniref:hypothetical protein n=1 Tax=Bdellovibrio sp. HCB337 TaxID=3394358 RepID=UPI0039A77AB7